MWLATAAVALAGNAAVGPVAEGHSHRDHVIILGYGLNGRNLARVLRVVDIDYVVLELNPETVRLARQEGEPVVYGDCTRPPVLGHLGVRTARMLVVAISDPVSSRRAVLLARRMNPDLAIIVRTRHVAEVEQLRQLGANLIIPEEFETSVEIFARVLEHYAVPRNLILGLIDRVREDHYEVLRDLRGSATKVEVPFDLLEKMEIETCQVRPDGGVAGRTVGELNLRAATGASLVAVRRGGQLLTNPGADFRFESGDLALLIGDRPQIDRTMPARPRPRRRLRAANGRPIALTPVAAAPACHPAERLFWVARPGSAKGVAVE
ncbi:MAG: NAD-binding protein [Gemmataceae bacterium]